MKKHHFIYILILISCVFSTIYLYFYLNTYQNITNSYKITGSKYDFLESSNSLIENLKDAETSQRGYLITADSQYLKPFTTALYRLEIEQERFDKMVLINNLGKGHEDDYKMISEIISKKISEMQLTIELFNKGKRNESIALVKSDLGLNLMNKITDLFQQLNTEQKYRETQAKQQIHSSRFRLKIFNISILILNTFILIIIGFIVNRMLSEKPVD